MDEWKKIENPVELSTRPRTAAKPAAVPPEAEPPLSSDPAFFPEPEREGSSAAIAYFEAEEKGSERKTGGTESHEPPRKPRKKRSDAGVPRKKKTPPPPEPEKERPPVRALAAEGPGGVIHSPRYGSSGRRRGRRRYAAPLGLLILLLAAVGVVSLVVTGINLILRQNDDTGLRTQIMDFLDPVLLYNPTAFSDVNETQQDALLQAAVWRVTEKERIRQLRVKDDVNTYSIDELGRMVIPVKTIEESYAVLFGPNARPYHHTVGEPGTSVALEYDGDNSYYHVPISAIGGSSTTLYVPVLDSLSRRGETLTARIGYVPAARIGIDDKGEEIPPTFNMATIVQLYSLQKNGSGWMITAITDEKK
ncbi:MAG: hypothetical protein HFJ80_00775 [Clostridiales bacterium]|nr:hypothetical protein [Clostridiales bacterium]